VVSSAGLSRPGAQSTPTEISVRRLLSIALIAVTALTAVGCSDSTGPAASLSGTYNLRTINNQPLPATLYYTSASDHIEILNSQITLFSDGTYADNTRVQDTSYGPTTVYDDNTVGYWVLSGSNLSLTDRNDPTHVSNAYVSGSQLQITNFAGYNATAIYSK
jgi:hypothetical protein